MQVKGKGGPHFFCCPSLTLTVSSFYGLSFIYLLLLTFPRFSSLSLLPLFFSLFSSLLQEVGRDMRRNSKNHKAQQEKGSETEQDIEKHRDGERKVGDKDDCRPTVIVVFLSCRRVRGKERRGGIFMFLPTSFSPSSFPVWEGGMTGKHCPLEAPGLCKNTSVQTASKKALTSDPLTPPRPLALNARPFKTGFLRSLDESQRPEA